jgi:hypothetical protein
MGREDAKPMSCDLPLAECDGRTRRVPPRLAAGLTAKRAARRRKPTLKDLLELGFLSNGSVLIAFEGGLEHHAWVDEHGFIYLADGRVVESL